MYKKKTLLTKDKTHFNNLHVSKILWMKDILHSNKQKKKHIN